MIRCFSQPPSFSIFCSVYGLRFIDHTAQNVGILFSIDFLSISSELFLLVYLSGYVW